MTSGFLTYLAKVAVLATAGVLLSLMFRWMSQQRPIDLRPHELVTFGIPLLIGLAAQCLLAGLSPPPDQPRTVAFLIAGAAGFLAWFIGFTIGLNVWGS